MATATSGRKPNYFFLAFGAPDAKKPPVEHGIYPHWKGFVSSSGIVAGDVMLLYCCDGYPEHAMEAPGVGVVTGTETGGEEEIIYYQYFPLCHPVGWSTITASIPELKGNTNFSLAGNWLRAISSSSFRAAIAGRQIDWP